MPKWPLAGAWSINVTLANSTSVPPGTQTARDEVSAVRGDGRRDSIWPITAAELP